MRRSHRSVTALLVLMALGAIVAVAARSGFGGELVARFRETGPAGPLVNLEGINELGAAFNEADGSPRLVVLLSPT